MILGSAGRLVRSWLIHLHRPSSRSGVHCSSEFSSMLLLLFRSSELARLMDTIRSPMTAGDAVVASAVHFTETAYQCHSGMSAVALKT